MALRWNRKSGNLTAVGRRARYTIAYRGVGTLVLTGVGWDSLPLLDLPPYGACFLSEAQAQQGAEEVDARQYVEPEMSGT